MTKFNRVNWHDATFAQITSPILVGILVINLVLKIVREKILQFNGGTQLQVDFWKFPGKKSLAPLEIRSNVQLIWMVSHLNPSEPKPGIEKRLLGNRYDDTLL